MLITNHQQNIINVDQLCQRIKFLEQEIASYNQITEEVEEYVNEREKQIELLTKDVTSYKRKYECLKQEKDLLSSEYIKLKEAYEKEREKTKYNYQLEQKIARLKKEQQYCINQLQLKKEQLKKKDSIICELKQREASRISNHD